MSNFCTTKFSLPVIAALYFIFNISNSTYYVNSTLENSNIKAYKNVKNLNSLLFLSQTKLTFSGMSKLKIQTKSRIFKY